MKVKFIPQNIELEIQPDQSVMQVAHENGVKIKSICNGMPSCAECRVKLVEGESNVLPPSAKELSLIGSGYFIDQRRLSCQLRCFGDVTVDLEEQVAKAERDTHKRPQGSLRKDDAEESFAVTGNLIEDDPDAVKLQTPQENTSNEPKGESKNTNKRRNNNRRRNRRGGRRK